MTSERKGIIVILLLLLVVSIAVLMQEPMAQSLEYHQFSDNRVMLSVPNFLNVASNLAFVFVGIMGLYGLNKRKLVGLTELKAGYFLLFLGVFLVGLGSGYYHLSPSNQTLVWDRLPMTVSFMSLYAIILAEYVSVELGRRLLYPLLLLGCASVFYWHYTEGQGAGDLRFYFLVQYLPLITIPVILLFLKPAFSHGSSYWWLILSYVAAKVFEHFDAEVFDALFLISGHTLKHLVAAFGILLLILGYQKRAKLPG